MTGTPQIKPISLFDYFGAIIIMLIFFGGVAFVWNITRESKSIPPQQRKIVECPPTIGDYQDVVNRSGQVVKLIPERVSSYGENGQFKNKQVIITKIETEKSKIACGYISVIAGTSDYGALQSWENIYINPNQFGGHISPKNQFGPGDGRDYSDYLFPLDKIQYWPTRKNKTIRNADWASLLNVSNEVTFEIAVNTTNPKGFVKNVSIAYKCWNPKTGEDNKDCKIEVKSTTDSVIKNF